MRRLVSVKLKQGDVLNIVAYAPTKEKARAWAAENSNRLLGNKDMFITKTSPILTDEEWNKDRAPSYQDGGKLYFVAFILENIAQFMKINAPGVKSAYNNVMVKYGIQDNLNMMIYEINQEVKKKSAIKESANTIKDRKALNKVLKEATDKVNNSKELKANKREVVYLMKLINDYSLEKYTDVNSKKIECALACLMYFNSPSTLTLEEVSETTDINEIDTLLFAVNQMRDEIKKYYERKVSSDGLLVTG